MKEFTKLNPGCICDMYRYLSEVSGVSITKEVEFKNIYHQPKNGKKGKVKYKADNIKVVDKEGNAYMYMQGQKRFDQCGIIAEKFLVKFYRKLSEFNIPINTAGTYKDSLGGGWYSNVQLYKVNEYYFASLDCRCN